MEEYMAVASCSNCKADTIHTYSKDNKQRWCRMCDSLYELKDHTWQEIKPEEAINDNKL